MGFAAQVLFRAFIPDRSSYEGMERGLSLPGGRIGRVPFWAIGPHSNDRKLVTLGHSQGGGRAPRFFIAPTAP